MNKIIIALLIVAFACVNAFNITEVKEELSGLDLLPRFLPYNISEGKRCVTEEIWAWKKAKQTGFSVQEPLACATEGVCDTYSERNIWRGRTNTIRLYITVLCTSTSCPLTQAQVTAQVNQINQDFAGTNFSFTAGPAAFKVDNTYAEIAAYSQTNTQWYTQLTNLKNLHAYQPTSYLNVFVTKQKSGTSGTLLGIGTFPWDSAATRATGGLWMNANYVGGGQKTAAHEIGHCVGLWHTFHGISEVSCSSGCYEPVHQDFSDTSVSNTLGDLCADTPSQPTNYNCANPSGTDCRGTAYTAIPDSQKPALLNNIMAYTPDNCMQKFTPQQAMRAHCWTCRKTPGWSSTSSC